MAETETLPDMPLARLIREQGRKQVWVAEQMGWSRALLQRVLSGDRPLTGPEMVRLGELFNVPAATFLPEVA